MGSIDPSPRANRRLDTWKEIGAFFGRDERTVKRWETTRGLPVHRVPGTGRANVYANTDELAEWLRGTRAAVEADPEASSEILPDVELDSETATGAAAYTIAASADRRLGERRSAERARWSLRIWERWFEKRYFVALLAVLLLAIAIVTMVRRISSVRAEHTTAVAIRHRPIDPEAEQFYLKGLYYWHKRTPEALHQAVDYFTQAVV